jgi:elongator complex protein 1
MALHEINVRSNAIDVSVNSNRPLISVLHQQGISVFEWKSTSASGPPPELTGRYTFEECELAENRFQQISFGHSNEILSLHRQGANSLVTCYGFNEDTGRVDRKSPMDTPSLVITTLSSFNEDGSVFPFAQDILGSLHNFAPQSRSLSHCAFPTALPWIEMTSYNGFQIAFGMSNNGHLYANSRLLVKNCTSFLTTSAHLIFTTTTHLIKFVHIAEVDGTLSLQSHHAKSNSR